MIVLHESLSVGSECFYRHRRETIASITPARKACKFVSGESWKLDRYATYPVPITPESEKAEAEHAAKVAAQNERLRDLREEAERESKWCEENRQRIIEHITSWATAKVWDLDGEQVRRFLKELTCNEYMPEIDMK